MTEALSGADAAIVFPHQLFTPHPACKPGRMTWLVEEYLFFRHYRFHKQKLAFHRASMKSWAANESPGGSPLHYVESHEPAADIRRLIADCAARGIHDLHIVEPADDWLQRRLIRAASDNAVHITWYASPTFLNTGDELRTYFTGKKKFHHADFYTRQRKYHRILVDDDGHPAGGRWSYDAENRLRYPRDLQPPVVEPTRLTEFHVEATDYVLTRFAGNPGMLEGGIRYPVTRDAAMAWLQDFLRTRFREFGPYEDAIVARETILHHSLLSPLLNIGLLTPAEVIRETLAFASETAIPLPSLEGFIRQIIGWREFIHGIYLTAGRRQRTTHYWGFRRKIPASLYSGQTGILPVDMTIRKILETGYCHHIERLMVLGNFMLLCEFDPDDVYRWFMELFIDAYDWVMVPNVYGMSQFADGGLMTSKPYISGSNYLMRMSDYPKGPWQATWDGLFWRFLHVHRDFFASHPRLGMLLKTWDGMLPAKRESHL